MNGRGKGCRKKRQGANCWRQELLKEAGYKSTQARQAILDILEKTDSHLSVEDIFEIISKTDNKMDLTTIYRNLEILENIGIVLKYDFGDGRARYELVKNYHKNPHHYHLVCKNCGRIIDFTKTIQNMNIVDSKKIAEKFDFLVDEEIYQLRGTCANCRDK